MLKTSLYDYGSFSDDIKVFYYCLYIYLTNKAEMVKAVKLAFIYILILPEIYTLFNAKHLQDMKKGSVSKHTKQV